MIRVTIDSIKVSLVSHHRVVVLKEMEAERYLPIWIGPFEADAITTKLQGVEVARPLTHDLLRSIIQEMGATISHVLVSDLRDETFYGRIVLELNGRHLKIDSRPSDALALAVRANVPVYVEDSVMVKAGIKPILAEESLTPEEEETLSIFREFVDTLDIDDISEEGKEQDQPQ